MGVPLLLALFACTPTGCTTPSTSVVPSYPPTSSTRTNQPTSAPVTQFSPGPGNYSDSGIEIFGGQLTTRVNNNDGQKIAGAQLRLYGATMAIATIDSSGQSSLAPLAAGTGYRLIISAPGYATQQLGNIEIKKKAETTQQATLQPESVLAGRVLAGGQPVEAAVVSDGLNSALTDAAGKFELHGVAAGQVTLTASKNRFQTASRELSVASKGAENLDLELSAATPEVYFDPTVSAGVELQKFNGLRETLQTDGWTLVNQPPQRAGVWVVVSPSQAMPPAAVERIAAFVAQGGKLMIFGEWGGFGGFRNPAVNVLAHTVGLHFNPDLVRVGTEKEASWLTANKVLGSNPAMRGINEVKFYDACSLFGLAPMLTYVQTSSAGYRVQDNAVAGSQTLVMGGPFKGGKAIALADTSGFTDDDTDGNGVSNLMESDNQKLIGQLFNW